MLYIAFVFFLSIFLFTYNKNHLSQKKNATSKVIAICMSRTCVALGGALLGGFAPPRKFLLSTWFS